MKGHSRKPGMNYPTSMACAIGAAFGMLAVHVHAQHVPLPQTAAEVPGPAPGPMTNAYVQMVGRMADVWGSPLVDVSNQRTALTKVPMPLLANNALCRAPMHEVSMLTGSANPTETSIADPNQDVVYG